MAFMAGAYTVTFGIAMGYTEVGFEMIIRPSFNPIRTDETGRTPVDGIWTGVEDIIVRVEGIEWSTAIWQKAIDFIKETSEGDVQVAGGLVSNLSDTLVLTPVTGPAATANAGGLYTFNTAYPLEPVRTVFSSQRLRSTSMGFYCFAGSLAAHVATFYGAAYA